jgi:hypothetical protein
MMKSPVLGTRMLQATLLFIALWFRPEASSAQPADPNAAFFPMKKGTVWVYQGTQKRTEGKTVVAKQLTWTMEAIDEASSADRKAVRFKGHPSDLDGFEKNVRSDYWMIQSGHRIFLLEDERAQEDPLRAELREGEIILDLPLTESSVFGEADMVARGDRQYYWVVDSIQDKALKGIKGVSSKKVTRFYEVAFRTLPDHEIIDYAAGIGIVRYQYAHHGTVAACDMKLVEFRPAP